MAFNVLKDPKDPRNFIVQPVPVGGVDPNLIARGTQAGQAGTLSRPQLPTKFGRARGTEAAEAQFGPGSEEAFAQGLFNFRGRLNEKRFEQNKAVFEGNLVRDGLNINAPGVREALNEAYKATNGFAVAQDVAADFFFNQPEQQAQRAVDLKALQDKQERDATTATLDIEEKRRNKTDAALFMGVSPDRVTNDRLAFNTRMTAANLVRDMQTLNERYGAIRGLGPTFSAELAGVEQAYADLSRQLTVFISQNAGAGALSSEELKFFQAFLPEFGQLAPIQDSTRRVGLGNAFNLLQSGATDIAQSNRALREGSLPAVWDLGDQKSVKDILFLEGNRPGDIPVPDLGAARAEQAGDQAVPVPAEDDFFGGLGEQPTPLAEQSPLEAVGTGVGAILGGASEAAQQFTDEEERRRIRERAGR